MWIEINDVCFVLFYNVRQRVTSFHATGINFVSKMRLFCRSVLDILTKCVSSHSAPTIHPVKLRPATFVQLKLNQRWYPRLRLSNILFLSGSYWFASMWLLVSIFICLCYDAFRLHNRNIFKLTDLSLSPMYGEIS